MSWSLHIIQSECNKLGQILVKWHPSNFCFTNTYLIVFGPEGSSYQLLYHDYLFNCLWSRGVILSRIVPPILVPKEKHTIEYDVDIDDDTCRLR